MKGKKERSNHKLASCVQFSWSHSCSEDMYCLLTLHCLIIGYSPKWRVACEHQEEEEHMVLMCLENWTNICVKSQLHNLFASYLLTVEMCLPLCMLSSLISRVRNQNGVSQA